MTIYQAILVFFAGALASALNGVAGGGTFVSFPALLFSGVPPISANTTSTLSLEFGTIASSRAYRRHLNISRRVLLPMIFTSIIGGLGGALLLIYTPARTFLLLIPWLLLGATLLFIFGGRLTRFQTVRLSADVSNAALAGVAAIDFLVGVYGGYFGGGIGILHLSMFAALGMTDIHAMNALKTVLAGTINGVATIAFILTKTIFWPQALVMSAGALLGGYLSAHYAQRLPQAWGRYFVILVGLSMTAYFFLRAYR